MKTTNTIYPRQLILKQLHNVITVLLILRAVMKRKIAT